MNEVMGQGRGEPDLGLHRVVMENYGRTVDIPGVTAPFPTDGDVPLYALASEIDDWG